MYYIYILKSTKTGRYYVGYSCDVQTRLKKHNSGNNKSTKLGAPWVVVRTENFSNKRDAWLRERQIKSYKGGEAFKKLIV